MTVFDVSRCIDLSDDQVPWFELSHPKAQPIMGGGLTPMPIYHTTLFSTDGKTEPTRCECAFDRCLAASKLAAKLDR